MIHGIIISSIFSEQGKLVLRAAPLQNQFAGAVEAIDTGVTGYWVRMPQCASMYLYLEKIPMFWHSP
jgi:hypothetical protein